MGPPDRETQRRVFHQHAAADGGPPGDWSYVIIFAAAALECAAFLGLVVPGESLVLASGFFAHQGILELDAVMVAVALGATMGDNIGYYLGLKLGREWLLRHGSRFGIRKRRLQQVEVFFQRHGPKAVFFGRFIGFARALVPFVAGTSRMRYRQFLIYNARRRAVEHRLRDPGLCPRRELAGGGKVDGTNQPHSRRRPSSGGSGTLASPRSRSSAG